MIKQGHYPDLSNDDYHKDNSFSKSGIKHLRVSGQHYDLSKETSDTKSSNLIVGSAFHQIVEDEVLKTKVFESDYMIRKEFSGKGSVAAKKEWEGENKGKQFLSQAEHDQIRSMRDSVLKHPIVMDWLEGSAVENSFFWEDEETGLMCKTRPDYLRLDAGVGLDLKSSANVDESEFSKSILNFDYHAQAAMCIDGVNHFLPGTIKSFIFIVVEKQFPFDIKLFSLSDKAIEKGREVYKYWLERLKQYQSIKKEADDKTWIGSLPELKEIDIPPWGYTSK